jgi:hypothetical protein
MLKLFSVILMVAALTIIPPGDGVWASPAAELPGMAEKRALSLALDAEGRPWAVWVVDNGEDTNIYYSRRDKQEWLVPQPLGANSKVWEDSPSLAFAGDGAAGKPVAWAAWSASTGPDQTSILVSHWQGRDWSLPAPVPGTRAMSGRQPTLAAAPNGDLWLAWVGHDGTDDEIYASHWDGTAWSAPQRVGTDDTAKSFYDTHPSLAVDGQGHVWLAWASHEGPLNDEIHASHWNGLDWSPQQQVNTSDDTPDVWPSIALDTQGQPWIAWQGAADEVGRWRIYLSHRDASQAGWTPEVAVSSTNELDVDERQPSLAFDADGKLHLSWAISGEISGLAHTSWTPPEDGRYTSQAWSTPTWTETSQSVEAPAIATDDETWILWLDIDSQESAPIRGQSTHQMQDRLPRSLPSRAAASSSTPTLVDNRHLAHGDSITCGCYEGLDGLPVVPYPTVLEQHLDTSVGDAEVVNSGKPGEKARAAQERLKQTVTQYQPEFLEIMEGTNDVTRNYSAAETAYAVRLLIRDARAVGDPNLQIVVATLIPRKDHHLGDTEATNREIFVIARKENVPVADQWGAYMAYGPWEELIMDRLHPETPGLKIIADTFFQTMVDTGMLPSDTTPPTAEISSLAAESECTGVPVAWTGDDGTGSGIRDFDVQVQDNGGSWTDWLVETPDYSGTYTGAPYNHTLGFRVRARDQVGLVGEYSPPATTKIVDDTPPDMVAVNALSAYQIAPFAVSWRAYDACSQITKYDVEYRVGTGSWQRWLTATTGPSEDFSPSSPQCGEVYSFRARAYDAADNQSDWSNGTASTTLACHGATGNVLTVRETPVLNAVVSASPSALGADPSDSNGAYAAYFAASGDYDLTVQRQGYGAWPSQRGVTVDGNTQIDFILPPLDDQVDNGGFEQAGWGNWQQAGSNTPSITDEAHSGASAVLLDPGGGDSRLSQSVTLPASLEDGRAPGTLSFMARLEAETGPAGSISVRIAGATTLSEELTVSPGEWTHAWYDVTAFAGQTVELSFKVDGSRAVILDEVSLGPATKGVHLAFMPLVAAD